MNIKRMAILTLILLIVCGIIYIWNEISTYSCSPVGPSTTRCGPGNLDAELPITIDQAIEKGFPIYMPSMQIIESLDLSFPPIVTLKMHNSTCSYVEILFVHKQDSSLFVTMRVSNGCAFSVPSSMYSQELKLDWAKDQSAFLIEYKEETLIVIKEINGFQYLIVPEGSMTTTLEFLESMTHVNDDSPANFVTPFKP